MQVMKPTSSSCLRSRSSRLSVDRDGTEMCSALILRWNSTLRPPRLVQARAATASLRVLVTLADTRPRVARSLEPTSCAVAGIFAPVRVGTGVAVDEDASILVRLVLEARVRRVWAEEQRVARLRQDRHGIALAQLGAIAFEVDSTPLRATRHELERPAIGRHLVEHDQRLHEAAAAVDVRPRAVAF